ncbi:16697_t:CDS:1, partial [Acaulospora colombiana]
MKKLQNSEIFVASWNIITLLDGKNGQVDPRNVFIYVFTQKKRYQRYQTMRPKFSRQRESQNLIYPHPMDP